MSFFLLASVSFSLTLYVTIKTRSLAFFHEMHMHILLCLPGGNHIHQMINKRINGALVRYVGGLQRLHEPIQEDVGE